MGYETVAIGRGADKRQTALDLGAHHYIDGSAEEAGRALRAMGGARLILFTAASSKPLAGLVDGLAPHGRLTVVGFDGSPLQLPLDKLVMHARHVTGHVTGSPVDTEQAMRFALASGVRPQVQSAPLEQAADALKIQQAGQARFRMVLTTGD
ncbi:zinc-binding dehydrogenase [Streptomyces sp. NPDC004237]|uniref:zinc-binding dehydrogenase n=1 Tax=Streptomyces sp. NPDC004237 TaxID=3154455 RepID=UPI0033B9CCE6